MKQTGYDYEILFMDAEDSVLVKRYKESRRSHPLARTGRVDEGIRLEREKTKFLRKSSVCSGKAGGDQGRFRGRDHPGDGEER